MIIAFSKSTKWRRSLNHTQNTYDYDGFTKSSKKTPRTRLLRFPAGAKLERKAYFYSKIGFLFEFRSFKKSKTRTRGSFLMKNELLARVSHLKKALKSKGPKVEREA